MMTEIALGFTVPKSQRFLYRVEPQPGRLMTLGNIGGQMVQLAKFLKAAAKEAAPNQKWEVLILGIETSAEGVITYEVAIAPQIMKRNRGEIVESTENAELVNENNVR